jgi:transcriptional regulator with XRE-family HTH domain
VADDFALRLNELFEMVRPPGRGPLSSSEVLSMLYLVDGVRISAPYLSQLRLGRRANPSPEVVAAIAGCFRVDPRYFTDDAYRSGLREELKLLAETRDSGVRTIAARTAGLSPTAQRRLADYADEWRSRENLQRITEN